MLSEGKLKHQSKLLGSVSTFPNCTRAVFMVPAGLKPVTHKLPSTQASKLGRLDGQLPGGAPRSPPASLSRSSPWPACTETSALLAALGAHSPSPPTRPHGSFAVPYTCQSHTRDGVGSECDLVQRQIYTRPFINNLSSKGDAERQPGVCPL